MSINPTTTRRIKRADEYSGEAVQLTADIDDHAVTVDVYGAEWRYGRTRLEPARVSWPSIGSVSVAGAHRFAYLITEAAETAARLEPPTE